jgi:hypothetical protein
MLKVAVYHSTLTNIQTPIFSKYCNWSNFLESRLQKQNVDAGNLLQRALRIKIFKREETRINWAKQEVTLKCISTIISASPLDLREPLMA